MIEVPTCDYTYTERDNNAALTRWSLHPYVNDSIIDSFFSKELTPFTMDSWYSAFLKIEDIMYPVLFRGPISRKMKDYNPTPDWLDGTSYRIGMDVGPSIEENEICVSKNVLEAMIWQGHMPLFTMKNGCPEHKSVLDSNMTCSKGTNGIDVEIMPYDFTNKLLDYFTEKKNWLNSNFKLTDNPYHENPYINSIAKNATKGILLNDCIIGEQARTDKIDLSNEWKKIYNVCYFLSFTSYGSINILFDRQKVVEGKKKLQMETGQSVEESMLEYNAWIESQHPTEARIVVDKSGVEIYNTNEEEKKVEEDVELLI